MTLVTDHATAIAPSDERHAPRLVVTAVNTRRGTVLCRLQGEIDLSTRGHIAAAVEGAVDTDVNQLVIDLADATFSDSTGLHDFLEIRNSMTRKRVAVSLINATSTVRRALDMSDRNRPALDTSGN